MTSGPGLRELVEDAHRHGRRELLGGEAIPSADDQRVELAEALLARLAQCGDDVQVERLAHCAGLLRAIQHGDPARARGQRADESVYRERPVQPHLEESDLVAARVQPVDRVVRDLGAGPHHDQHPFGLGMTNVVE